MYSPVYRRKSECSAHLTLITDVPLPLSGDPYEVTWFVVAPQGSQ